MKVEKLDISKRYLSEEFMGFYIDEKEIDVKSDSLEFRLQPRWGSRVQTYLAA